MYQKETKTDLKCIKNRKLTKNGPKMEMEQKHALYSHTQIKTSKLVWPSSGQFLSLNIIGNG